MQLDNTSVAVNATYSGLSGPATAAHIHYGTPAASGPVVLPFSPPLTSPFSETLTAANYVAAMGAPADFPTFVTALRAGGAGYINFHTSACGPGEIRAGFSRGVRPGRKACVASRATGESAVGRAALI